MLSESLNPLERLCVWITGVVSSKTGVSSKTTAPSKAIVSSMIIETGIITQ